MQFKNLTAPSSLLRGRRRASSERGAAIFETALVTPVLVLILFCLVQGVYLSQAYMSVNHIAREAMLLASTLRNAQVGQKAKNDFGTISETDVRNCLDATPGAVNGLCAHLVAHWRILRLLESNNLKVNDFSFSSERTAIAVGSAVDNNMEIKIYGTPSVTVPLVGSAILRAKASAGYVTN